MFKFGSLFAGIGGFDLGLERAGMECAWQVEIDAKCNTILERHFPNAKRYKDVNYAGRDLGPVDLVCGGFPCQDLSVAGKRKGLAGERSGLWFEFHRILAELGPPWVIIENVPGLLSSNGGRDFATILQGLVELRYGVCWRVLDAQYFGVAQRRRRVFIVGYLGGGHSAEVLFESEGCAWDPPPSREEGQRVADPITKSFAKHHGASAGKDSLPRNHVVTEISHALTSANTATGRLDPTEQGFVIAQCQGSNVGPMGELRKGDGGVTSGVPFVAYGISENQRAELRLTPYSRQITSGGGKPGQGYPAALTQYGVRRLMPIECERLQGFPDSWTAGLSDTARYKMLGNAVAVPVAEWLGRRIVETDPLQNGKVVV